MNTKRRAGQSIHRVARRLLLSLVAASLVAPLAAAAAGANAPSTPAGHKSGGLDGNLHAQARQGHYSSSGRVGAVTAWPAAEVDSDGITSYYLKDFRLAGVGPHVEVWLPVGDSVTTGLDFAAGDCRNGELTTVTDDQVNALIGQFENVIRPREASVFGVPTKHDGKQATLPQYDASIPANAYRGPGDRTVVLVDNFRDGLFRGDGPSRAGEVGFVDPAQMSYVDRNVVNLRGLGWSWLLGANPAAEVVTNSPCTARTRIPSFVEAFLTNEYTHILQASAAPDNAELNNDPTWLLNGEAIWAMYLAGYVDPATADVRNQMIECFYGELSVRPPNPLHACQGGPEQSLTNGSLDQDPRSSRGARGSFMELLDSRYGHGFIGDLLRTTDVWGAAKVDAVLARHGVHTTFNDLVGDWSAAMALDGVLDDGASLIGGDASRYQVTGLHTHIAWDSPFADQALLPTDPPQFGAIGVAPNGSDFTRLRDGNGAWLNASQLDSLDFNGETHLNCLWVVDPNGHGAGDAALYSGTSNNQNRAISTAIDVPTANPTLDFDTKYQAEPGYDFAFVQISADNGVTWTSLSSPNTTSDHAPDDPPEIVHDLPGYNGDSNGWIHQHLDLSPWTGQHVQLAFRYRADSGVALPGFWVDNVAIGGTLIDDGTTLAPFQNIFLPVYKLMVRLVSYTDDHHVAAINDVALDADNDAHLDAAQLRALVAPGAQTVAVLVTFIQPNSEFCHVLYTLTINGVHQPGG